MVSWFLWSLEHLCYHLPVRVMVLPGDLSQHDFHHRNPATLRWTETAFAREVDIDCGDMRWPNYRKFWGLHNAVFKGISKAPVNLPARVDRCTISNHDEWLISVHESADIFTALLRPSATSEH